MFGNMGDMMKQLGDLKKQMKELKKIEVVAESKNEVGGNCLLSPTTTSCLALNIDPNASTGLIWLASSNITTSNRRLLFSINWATDIGLIKKSGFRSSITSPHSLISFLIDFSFLFLESSFFKTPNFPAPKLALGILSQWFWRTL